MKKTSLLFLVILFSTTFLNAQNQTSKHQYGILFGGIFIEQIGVIPELSTTDPYEEEIGSGFTLGILYQYQITNFLAIRPQATIQFRETAHYNKFIQMDDFNTSFVHTVFPVHAILSVNKWKFVPYIAVGGRYELEIAENRNNNLPELNKNNSFAVDAGFGISFKTDKFLLRPEIIGSWGVNNIVDVPAFSGDVRRNSLEVRLIFQGN